MNVMHVVESAVIEERPEAVYAVLADYRVSHPAILPRPPFTTVTVEKGGQGAGTVASVGVMRLGTEQKLHMTISEPQPSRLLVETDPDAGVTTTFTIDH